MKCRLCGMPLEYVHGHGACLNLECPLKGQNQAACCEGETAENTQPAPQQEKKKSAI